MIGYIMNRLKSLFKIFANEGAIKAIQVLFKFVEFKYRLNVDNPKSKFTWIYENKYWASDESVSGYGSGVAYTENIRNKLPQLIDYYKIKSLLDAPCGDFHWMKLLLSEIPTISYIGVDIVSELIDKLNYEYSNSRISFQNVDIRIDSLPSADLIIVRDCLFHLSEKDIYLFLNNFLGSDIKYILTTTHVNIDGFSNKNIQTGDFRRIDLLSKPYFFPPPILEIIDFYEPEPPRIMGLWAREQLLKMKT
jgi:SAM-dependent methyltransferase